MKAYVISNAEKLKEVVPLMGKGDKFVKALITHHHEAMLEHGDYIFMVDDEHIWDNVFEALKIARESTVSSPRLLR